MSKKRGLSVEEKRGRMMEIFHEKKEFFQLKELEKIGPKEKGIVAQSIKDVLQSLVDDGMVETDKIGTSVYYWSFPSKVANNRREHLNKLRGRSSELKKAREKAESSLATAKSGRKEDGGRDELMEGLKREQRINEDLKEKMKQFEEFDPDVLEKTKDQSKLAREAANRWTDNVFAVKSWCKNKFYMEESVLNKQFAIPEELDYL